MILNIRTLATLSVLLISATQPLNNENRYYSLEELVLEEGSIYVSYDIDTEFGGLIEMNNSKNQREVNKIIEFLKNHPEIKLLEIGAHLGMSQDPNLSYKHTQANSQKIKEYMIDGGIDESILIAKGYEFTKPLINTGNEYIPKNNYEAYSTNKKFEFKICKVTP